MIVYHKSFNSTLPLLLLALTSCWSLRQSPKYELEDGIYNSTLVTRHGNKVYIEIHEDTIKLFSARKKKQEYSVNETEPVAAFPENLVAYHPQKLTLYKPSFDIDLLTIPVKYRPQTEGFPRQLNSSLSGALVLGGRYDLFKIHYHKTPLKMGERKTDHFGIASGLFGGFGITSMNPWVTNNKISIEYDGATFQYGLSLMVGFNQFTAGIAIGTDHLMDPNRQYWIYQNKIWAGLAFGLNLN